MGVAGAGKTTVGRQLAQAIGWEFHDADEFHSPENIAKMHRGEGLTDDDRRPWLARLSALIATIVREDRHAVLACSALKHSYREALIPPGVSRAAVRFVYLDVPATELQQRLKEGKDPSPPPERRASQPAPPEAPRDGVGTEETR